MMPTPFPSTTTTTPDGATSATFSSGPKASNLASLVRRHRRFKRYPSPWTIIRNFATPYIVNLSSLSLSNAQCRVLNKGLGFVPAVYELPSYDTSLSKFSRAVRLRDYFNDTDNPSPVPKPPPFKPKSTWMPVEEMDLIPLSPSVLDRGEGDLKRGMWPSEMPRALVFGCSSTLLSTGKSLDTSAEGGGKVPCADSIPFMRRWKGTLPAP